ncbi:MAG: hypothetical protein AAF702_17765 [Chloroflexota bacterium]
MSSRLVMKQTWNLFWTYPRFWFQVLAVIFVPMCVFQFGAFILQADMQAAMFEDVSEGSFPTQFPQTFSSFMGYYSIFMVAYWALSLVTRGVVVEGVGQTASNKDVSISALLPSVWPKVSRVAGIDLVLVGPLLIVYAVLYFMMFQELQPLFSAFPEEGMAEPSASFFALIPLAVCSTIILVIPLTAWTLFSSNAAILADLDLFSSLRVGVQFLREHLSSIIRLALLYIAISIIIGIAFAIVTAPLAFMSVRPAQQAMMECISNAGESREAINACVQQLQQGIRLGPVQIISGLINTLMNSAMTLVLLMSTSLLFYRLRIG